LLASQDAVFIDRLAHASPFDAARASRATLRVFHHNDTAHLAALLSRASKARRRVVVTEGVFSMEGDCAPLEELLDVAQTHQALVYVDDAHGAFVLGKTGRGTPEAAGVSHERLIYMGTLGKAVGCQGGFVVGPRLLIDFLHNRARTFIYTTALAVPIAAAAVEALRLLKGEPQRRERLRQLTERLHERLAPLQPVSRVRALPSHIVPFVVGEARQALELAQALWERGIWAPAIRPPTVPEGTARLRLNVTALHTEAQIDALAGALRSQVHCKRCS
ncbi:MAG: aminotransferase class I/II-fold pyridoxal phosphate-dependent enzyme, partial [Candidatus Omnitrophica bacterium]|nr:aminotransferase class I/II-fold pyridoxal phosphate-dependent enzyme [Candidatus Omnitrophota bacterium]